MEIHSERKKRLSLSLLFKIIKDTVWGFIDDSVMRLSASLAYAYGDQIEYFDHPSAIGFIRTGDEEHVGSGLVFLMSNDEAGSKKMDLGEEHKGEIWHEITGNIQQEITLDEKGSGEFSVNTRNIAVWIKKN